MSIRRKLTFTLVGILLVLLGAAGTGLYMYVHGALTQQFDESLVGKARALRTLMRVSDTGAVNFDFSVHTMPEFADAEEPEYFQLWTEDGTGVDRSKSMKYTKVELRPQKNSEPTFVDVSLPDGRFGRSVTLRVNSAEVLPRGFRRPSNSATQTYLLVVAREREHLNHTVTTIRAAGLGGVVILACAFALIVPWLIGRNLRPLATIAAQANRIDAGTLKVRFPVETMPLELQPICAQLNDSLHRLQGAFERERQFSGDVAHELRTPIAELRLLSELALKFPKDGVEARRSFQDSLEIARQMEHIVETLLEMLSNEVVAAAQLESTDLAEVVKHALGAFQLQAAGKNISLRLAGTDQILVDTDPLLLTRIFSNLLSNAVEYSPPGSTIDLRYEALPERAVVTLSNPTSNLVNEDLTHIAEPFWRKDPSRTGNRHAGLGLGLVVCFARRLNIKLRWILPAPGVFQVCMEFPRCETTQSAENP